MSENTHKADPLFHWRTNRRQVLKAALIAGVLSQAGFLKACKEEGLMDGNDLFSAEELSTLKAVMEILFPNDGNGPSLDEIHALEYLMWALHDEGASESGKSTLQEDLGWVMSYTKEQTGKEFYQLTRKKQERTIESLLTEDTGEIFCSTLLTFIFEAVVLDPIYGGNANESGWTWLEITPGQPRADESTRYENILATVRQSYQQHEI